jgi:acetyltransferase-like isoleucine patch superfamily enzyme
MMKKMFRKIRNEILYCLLVPFGKAFANRNFPSTLLAKHVVIQKLFRINGHVPWPVHWTSQVKSPEKIDRGTRCPGLQPGCYIDGRNGIIIGRNVWIGPKVNLISMHHNMAEYERYEKGDPIVIGNDCWLATGVTVLAGVKLGNRVICAAGAVVTRSFPQDNIMLAGVPARIVKELPPYGES